MKKKSLLFVIISFVVFFLTGCGEKKAVTTRTIPLQVERILCSGAGCLRLACYLQAEEKVIAVDDIEKRKNWLNTKPYSIAHPEFSNLPLFGEFRGHDNPELIVSLPKFPDVIFKTYPESGYDPVMLQKKTGIPVITINYGDLTENREHLFNALKKMGTITGKNKRAEQCIEFFKSTIKDLNARVQGMEKNRPVCYIGGIAFRGAHGLLSTEPGYASFKFCNAFNAASSEFKKKPLPRHMIISKEKLLEWNPDYLFIDLATTQLEGKANAVYQIQKDHTLRLIKAIKNKKVYFVLPYNSYSTNFSAVLINAYFIGKTIYPERFRDIDIRTKAAQIYQFLIGKDIFEKIDKMFGNQVFKEFIF